MNQAEIERNLVDFGHRVDRVEQILPALLTRDEFQTAIADVHRHFDVVAESLRGEIRLITEGHTYLVRRLDGIDQRLDRMDLRFDRMDLRFDRMDQRLDKIERTRGQ